MAGPPKLFKPTLDKDLDRITYVEEATFFVLRRYVPVALGLVFLLLVALVSVSHVMEQPGAIMIIAGAALAAYMAMNIGANDVTNNVGAAVGARAISMAGGLALAAVFEIAGAMIAGDNVVGTISSGIVDGNQALGPDQISAVMLSALLAAALWINIATWTNSPVSTTHSIVGAVMGAGLAAAGLGAVKWSMIGWISLSWVVSPILGGVMAALLLWFVKTTIIYQDDKIAAAKRWVPVLIGAMTGAFSTYLTIKGIGQVFRLGMTEASLLGLALGVLSWLVAIPLVARQAAGLENRNQSLRQLFRMPLIFSAALLSFAHGANDVANAIGPVTAIVEAMKVETPLAFGGQGFWIAWIGALGISTGLLLYGPKLIRLVGEQITKLNPMRAYCVAMSSATTVIAASWLGLPVSSTHIAVGAVFGVGLFREWYTRHSKRRIAYLQRKAEVWEIEDTREANPDEQNRRRLVRRSHILSILAAWLITLPVSAGLAMVLYWIIFAIFI